MPVDSSAVVISIVGNSNESNLILNSSSSNVNDENSLDRVFKDSTNAHLHVLDLSVNGLKQSVVALQSRDTLFDLSMASLVAKDASFVSQIAANVTADTTLALKVANIENLDASQNARLVVLDTRASVLDASVNLLSSTLMPVPAKKLMIYSIFASSPATIIKNLNFDPLLNNPSFQSIYFNLEIKYITLYNPQSYDISLSGYTLDVSYGNGNSPSGVSIGLPNVTLKSKNFVFIYDSTKCLASTNASIVAWLNIRQDIVKLDSSLCTLPFASQNMILNLKVNGIVVDKIGKKITTTGEANGLYERITFGQRCGICRTYINAYECQGLDHITHNKVQWSTLLNNLQFGCPKDLILPITKPNQLPFKRYKVLIWAHSFIFFENIDNMVRTLLTQYEPSSYVYSYLYGGQSLKATANLDASSSLLFNGNNCNEVFTDVLQREDWTHVIIIPYPTELVEEVWSPYLLPAISKIMGQIKQYTSANTYILNPWSSNIFNGKNLVAVPPTAASANKSLTGVRTVIGGTPNDLSFNISPNTTFDASSGIAWTRTDHCAINEWQFRDKFASYLSTSSGSFSAANDISNTYILPVNRAFYEAADASRNVFDSSASDWLYRNDDWHHSVMGGYIEALTIFGALTHVDVGNISWTPPVYGDPAYVNPLILKAKKGARTALKLYNFI